MVELGIEFVERIYSGSGVGFYEWIACVPTGLLATWAPGRNGSQDVVEHENVSQLLRERSRYSHRRDYYRTVTCLPARQRASLREGLGQTITDLLNASGEHSVIPSILSISPRFFPPPAFFHRFAVLSCNFRFELLLTKSSVIISVR